MALSKYMKARVIGNIVMFIFILCGLYLAVFYYIEHPAPTLHWEGIVPLLVCLVYLLFS